jgi:Protein of unknown function (DUF1579)
MAAKLVLSAAVAMALALVLVPVTGARADQAPDGRQATFDDRLLDSLVGHWNVSREIRGKQERNTLDVDWVLLHQFLELHMKDAAKPPQYEAIVLIGYDHEGQRYVIHWCDNFGGKFSLMGHGRRSGDSIEFVFEDPDSPFFNTFSRDPKTGTWTFVMESQGKDGKRVFFAKDTLSKR